MEKLCKKYRLKNTRIEGVDKTEDEPAKGCTLSHLKAIKHWFENSTSATAIICEDDLSLETVEHWPFTWNEVVKSLPFYWDVIQLCVTVVPKTNFIPSIHRKTEMEYSTGCYLINRNYAKRLIKTLYSTDLQNWRMNLNLNYIADYLIYDLGVCYTLPLFTYTLKFKSLIQNEEHEKYFHEYGRKLILAFWSSSDLVGKSRILQRYPQIILGDEKIGDFLFEYETKS